MQIDFAGNKRVRSTYKGFTVATDQPVSAGGDGSAPEPFDLFLASLGTCAGVYVAYFCESRKIPLDGVSMRLSLERDEQAHALTKVDITIELPPGFPDRYQKAVVRAAEMCSVKRTLAAPPPITVSAVTR
jgi:ribosomal protein S12 methylthiotransferase accessory factor